MSWGSSITYLAETRFKGVSTRFGIKDADRTAHLALIGQRGSGRALFLANMALQDIARGGGTLVIDGAGTLTQRLLERLPPAARERLIVLDPSDGEHPFSWNPLDDLRTLPEAEAHATLSVLLSEIYDVPPNPLFDAAAAATFAEPHATLLHTHDLIDAKAREKAGFAVRVPPDFASFLKTHPDAAAALADHGRYLAKDVLMRNVLGQTESKFTLERLRHGGIVVVDLSRIRMYPTRITPFVRLFLEIARRYHDPQAPVSLYLHDALRYLSPESLERALLDKGILLSVADTAYGEEPTLLREMLLHRAGSVFSFKPSETDVPLVERVFYPYAGPDDLEKLEENQLIVTLAIDAVRSRPFFAKAPPPPERSGLSPLDLALDSRSAYTISRLSADKLFRPKPQNSGKKNDDGGSFSNAFRSIFAKQAAAPAPAGAAAKPPAAPAPAPKPAEKPAPAPAPAASEPAKPREPKEIPEKELKKMVHVRHVKPKSD
jgi:hypothetical protein